ncbi:MAG: DUF177 domain-containing protein [Bdellovibrionales bacterium]|nr:DUF177 domain-containing protein [Bdellovibrionales bacterium]
MKILKEDPTVIVLGEIGEDGRQLSYDSANLAMSQALGDLIGDNPFKIQLFIRPMGNVFEATGQIESSQDLACYRCALDFKHPVRETIREILVIEDERPRSAKSARVNHSSELDSSGPSVTTLASELFNVADFVHEIIALAEPYQPKAKENCGDDCENLKEAFEKGWLSRAGQEGGESPKSENPFSILKDFKLNS